MNPASDHGPISPEKPSAPHASLPSPPHTNWREALMALIAARISLIQLESQAITKGGGKRVAFFATACVCAFFAWALLLAGTVSIAANEAGLSWDLVAIIAAAIHLLVGIILAKLAKPSAGPAFPNTRAEFQKDREWIENFHKTKKSSD